MTVYSLNLMILLKAEWKIKIVVFFFVVRTFQAAKEYRGVKHRMLPWILSWTITLHKLEGSIFGKPIEDFIKKNFAKGQVYEALSRVKTLERTVLSDLVPN